MASYVLPPPQTDGFLQGLGRGIGQGSSIYAQAAQSDYFERLKEKRRMEQEQAEQKRIAEETNKVIERSDLNPYQISVGPGGITTTYKNPEKKFPSFDEYIRNAITGNTSYEDVQKAYPTKYQQVMDIQKQQTPVEMVPGFKEGTGGMISRLGSYFSGSQAEINPETKAVIDQIKNQYDLDELLADYAADPESFKNAGVDVKAIKEFFGRP